MMLTKNALEAVLEIAPDTPVTIKQVRIDQYRIGYGIEVKGEELLDTNGRRKVFKGANAMFDLLTSFGRDVNIIATLEPMSVTERRASATDGDVPAEDPPAEDPPAEDPPVDDGFEDIQG
jgi:hypothetical protein